MNQTFLWEELPVRASALPDSEKDWLILVATSCSPISLFQRDTSLNGLSGKTFPVSCQVDQDGTLVPSSGRWLNSGMGSPTGFLTLSTSEFPSDAAVCSLSDILETGDVPQRFFLSSTACRGILRRAEKRGKKLPGQLEAALTVVVGLAQTSSVPVGCNQSAPPLLQAALEHAAQTTTKDGLDI